MRGRTAILLIVLGCAALFGALSLRPIDDTAPTGAGQLAFQGISATLPNAARVEINAAGKAATLVLTNGNWGLAERDLYPITLSKLRSLLTGLAELRLIEPRTADRDQLARLGVDDPASVGSTATGLLVRDASGAVLVDVILGHRRVRSQGGLPEAVYIRRPTETQSWLAEGQVPADADPQSWLVRELTDIPAEKIAHVVATRGADTLTFARTGDKFALAPPGDVKLDEYRIEEVSRALSGLTMVDVRKGPLPGTVLGSTAFATTDGLTVTVALSKDGPKLFASFTATGPGAETLAKLSGWAFEVSDWREKSLLPALADLKAAEPAPPAPTSLLPGQTAPEQK